LGPWPQSIKSATLIPNEIKELGRAFGVYNTWTPYPEYEPVRYQEQADRLDFIYVNQDNEDNNIILNTSDIDEHDDDAADVNGVQNHNFIGGGGLEILRSTHLDGSNAFFPEGEKRQWPSDHRAVLAEFKLLRGRSSTNDSSSGASSSRLENQKSANEEDRGTSSTMKKSVHEKRINSDEAIFS